MRRLTIFSWGFWGWGTATSHLVSAVDAAEGRRGFAPPLFVDIRFRRSGRAIGFRGDTFERLVGRRRYRWMPTLGNSSIGTSRAARIACPVAADHLLDTAMDAADRNSRVIFFCACVSPWGVSCHRHVVARLLRRAARRRRVPLDVQEWPGGRPSATAIKLRVSTETLRAVARGAKTVLLSDQRVPRALAGIPWGAIVVLRAGREELPVAVGPAAHRAGRWVLPRFDDGDAEPADDVRGLRAQAQQLRRAYGLDS